MATHKNHRPAARGKAPGRPSAMPMKHPKGHMPKGHMQHGGRVVPPTAPPTRAHGPGETPRRGVPPAAPPVRTPAHRPAAFEMMDRVRAFAKSQGGQLTAEQARQIQAMWDRSPYVRRPRQGYISPNRAPAGPPPSPMPVGPGTYGTLNPSWATPEKIAAYRAAHPGDRDLSMMPRFSKGGAVKKGSARMQGGGSVARKTTHGKAAPPPRRPMPARSGKGYTTPTSLTQLRKGGAVKKGGSRRK